MVESGLSGPKQNVQCERDVNKWFTGDRIFFTTNGKRKRAMIGCFTWRAHSTWTINLWIAIFFFCLSVHVSRWPVCRQVCFLQSARSVATNSTQTLFLWSVGKNKFSCPAKFLRSPLVLVCNSTVLTNAYFKLFCLYAGLMISPAVHSILSGLAHADNVICCYLPHPSSQGQREGPLGTLKFSCYSLNIFLCSQNWITYWQCPNNGALVWLKIFA